MLSGQTELKRFFNNLPITVHVVDGDIFFDAEQFRALLPIVCESNLAVNRILHYDEGQDAWAISIFSALSQIQQASYSEPLVALFLLKLLDSTTQYMMDEGTYSWIRAAIMESSMSSYVAQKSQSSDKREGEIVGIQTRFVENISDLIPGAAVIRNYKNYKKGHKPDFMVRIDGKIRPVEVKKNKAHGSDVGQILRYIAIYEADKGYLVAPCCSAEIPSTVEFIECH